MDKEMEWNAEVTKIHHTNYVRNSRAIAVAWFVFCACYTILNIVVFIQPFWFGDTNESPGVGYFGTYEWCERVQGSDYRCYGDFLDFNTISNNYFRSTSFLVGGACLLFIFSIICMLFFLFLRPSVVLRICGTLQLIAAVFMAVACIIYPNAFDDDDVRRICGQEAEAYNMDKCQIRWAYILAIVLIFDALILSVLAFVLAARQAKMIPEYEEKKQANSYDNNGFVGEFVDVVPSTRVKTAYRPQNPRSYITASNNQQQQQQQRQQRQSYTTTPVQRSTVSTFLPPPAPEPVNKSENSPRDTITSSSVSIPSPRSEGNRSDLSPRSNDDGENEDVVMFSNMEGRSSRNSSPGEIRSRSNRSTTSQHSDTNDMTEADFHF